MSMLSWCGNKNTLSDLVVDNLTRDELSFLNLMYCPFSTTTSMIHSRDKFIEMEKQIYEKYENITDVMEVISNR